jgi:hypothetical protein
MFSSFCVLAEIASSLSTIVCCSANLGISNDMFYFSRLRFSDVLRVFDLKLSLIALMACNMKINLASRFGFTPQRLD